MGFECYLVRLRGGQLSREEADRVIRGLPGARLDPESNTSPGSATTYAIEDGRQVFELELWHAPLELSCRFMLCNPPTVDEAFLSLIRELMHKLDMEVTNCEDDDSNRWLPRSEFNDFSRSVLDWIPVRRAVWVAMFGEATMAAGSRRAYEEIILPSCRLEVAAE